MRLQMLSNDGAVISVLASGPVTQDAFTVQDEPLAQQFGDEIYSGRVLLSLQDANYMDSRGIGWLLKCHRRFRQAGGAIVIHSIPSMISDVLVKVSHMDEVLNLSADEQAARDLALAAHG